MQNIIKAAAAFSLYTIESNTIGTRSCKALSNFLETRLPSHESFLEDFPILPEEFFSSEFSNQAVSQVLKNWYFQLDEAAG